MFWILDTTKSCASSLFTTQLRLFLTIAFFLSFSHSIKELADSLDTSPASKEAALDVLSDVTWSTRLSDGTKVVLKKDNHGDEKQVELKEIVSYCNDVVRTRLLESSRAVIAMRDGLSTIIPSSVLPLFTWREFESRVCGQPDVNIDLLMECTEYDDDVSPSEPHIIMFWDVLRSLTASQRRQFMRFVWARARLPPTAAEFKQKFKIQAPVGDGAKRDPDHYLPKAHTCFFSMNLPRYSNSEIMKTKILYAIYECTEMDADFRLAENEMTG